jgi:tripartite-type tricarboxylate transporter receptor subunit TctC
LKSGLNFNGDQRHGGAVLPIHTTPGTDMNRRNVLHQLAAAPLGLLGIAAIGTTPARAQGYPDRPVRILVGVPAGAGPDVEARAFAALLQVELGQTVLVENNPGFTGLLAMDAVAKAAPDGYTLGGCTPNNMTANPRLFDRPLYNVEKDIVPISQFIEHPWLLYVNAKVPARTLAEFVALAKASPGKISYATAGVGSFPHLTAEWFQKLAGIRLNHIPYGAAHWQNDLVAGTVDATFYPLVGMVDHVRSGKLRALAVASAGRSALLPEVPTFTEAGYPEYAARAWAGLAEPAATPAPVIERLAQACARAAQRPEFREFAAKFGSVVVGSSPVEFARYLRAERAQLQALIAENNIRVD